MKPSILPELSLTCDGLLKLYLICLVIPFRLGVCQKSTDALTNVWNLGLNLCGYINPLSFYKHLIKAPTALGAGLCYDFIIFLNIWLSHRVDYKFQGTKGKEV